MSVGRWLRNKGFAFTSEQRLDRWDDIGGPRGLERWALQSRSHFLVGRAVNGLYGIAGVLVGGWLVNASAGLTRGLLIGWGIGVGIGLVVMGNRLWHRDRQLYEVWLRRQERRRARQEAAT